MCILLNTVLCAVVRYCDMYCCLEVWYVLPFATLICAVVCQLEMRCCLMPWHLLLFPILKAVVFCYFDMCYCLLLLYVLFDIVVYVVIFYFQICCSLIKQCVILFGNLNILLFKTAVCAVVWYRNMLMLFSCVLLFYTAHVSWNVQIYTVASVCA